MTLALDQQNVVLIVSLVCGSVSLWGSSVIINAFFIFGKGRGFAIMVLLLALGDFIWAIASMGSAAALLLSADSYRTNVAMCTFFRLLYQFGAFSSLVWGLGILLFILVALARSKRPDSLDGDDGKVSRVWWIVLALIANGYPIIIGIVMVVTGPMTQNGMGLCYRKDLENALWVYVIIGIFFLSVILMAVVLYHYQGYRQHQLHRMAGRKVTLTVPFRSSLFSLVLIVCWTPNIVYQLIPDDVAKPFWFTVLYVALLNMQGLLDSLIYGFTNGRFRAFFRKRFLRTVLLLMFGPLLVVPLFLRWMIILLRRRCGGSPGSPSSDAFEPSSSSSLNSASSSLFASRDRGSALEAAPLVASPSSASGSLSASKSYFPLSSKGSHPLPRFNFAESFTPPAPIGVSSIQQTSPDLENDSDSE